MGMVAKRMDSGFGSLPIKPSHSSVTIKVIRMLLGFREIRNLHKLSMGLMCPLPGNGIATTWHTSSPEKFIAGEMTTER